MVQKENEFLDFTEKLIKINRCTKVVKGGRRFSFSALVAIGNKNGSVGIGFGKANETSEAMRKATVSAKKNIIQINMKNFTLLHEVKEKFCKSIIWMKPASEGTGLIAGGSVRSLLELAGVKNVLSKIRGSRNSINVIKAAFKCLKSLKDPMFEAKKRGKSLNQLYNISTNDSKE